VIDVELEAPRWLSVNARHQIESPRRVWRVGVLFKMGSWAGLTRLKGIARGSLGGLIAMVAIVRKAPRRLF